jgi:uncharacterized metal-binding protein
MKKDNPADCASCGIPIRDRACIVTKGKGSKGCPTAGKKKLVTAARLHYENQVTGEFARQASIQEGECYAGRDKKPYIMNPTKPRIQEICEFARKMGYSRLGLVFCAGLTKEALIVSQIFKNQGFETVSVICKAGAVPKEEIGIKDSEKIYSGQHESMCNPILQALIVNEAEVEFNILLGLCVGHDSLFFKYAEAPTTILAVKDRVTGHNPLAAVYLAGTYYSRLNKP